MNPMDETDDLKRLWQAETQRDAAHSHRAPEQLLSILKGRSSGSLRSLQLTILLEAIFGLCLMAFFWWWSDQVPELRWVCRSAALFFSPLYILYYRNFRQLQRAQQPTGTLREQLQATLMHWESALRLYVRLNMALLAPIFLIGGVLGTYSGGGMPAVQAVLLDRWYFWLPAAVLITWAMFPLMRWLTRLSYGRHLEKLNRCLLELESTAGE
ncbi:MAG: hypothetical protein ABIO24_05530 [Saprospiraceae bacterium]